MQLRFLPDENLDQYIVAGLLRRELSIDFELPQSFLADGTGDPAVPGIAASLGRVLVTHDSRTMPFHFAEFVQHFASSGLILVPPIGETISQGPSLSPVERGIAKPIQYLLAGVIFEWDTKKAASNLKKHGINFHEVSLSADRKSEMYLQTSTRWVAYDSDKSERQPCVYLAPSKLSRRISAEQLSKSSG